MHMVQDMVLVFSNVQGPQSNTKINTVKIRERMILSNEPGYYKPINMEY